MTDSRHTSAGDAEGSTNGAAAFVCPKRIGRRVLTRYLPDSIAVLAAFTMPELSVGAGDLAQSSGFDDPPEPAFKSAQGLIKIGQAPVKPQLAGVRYAAMLDLDLSDTAMLALPAVMANLPAGNRPDTESEPAVAASAPVKEPVAQAFVPPSPELAMAPLAGQDQDRAEVLAPASMPAPSVAAMAIVAEALPAVIVPAALPALESVASLPQADSAAAAVRSAPVAPARPPAAQLPAAQVTTLAAAPPVRIMQATPAARGMIEQVTPARIAAAQAPRPTAAPPAMSAPAAKPAAAAASVAVSAAMAAPAARAPISAPAPVARPAVVAPVAAPAPPAASAPAPARVSALAVPRPATPALVAPAASKPVMPAVTARLLTRVDGKTAGAVDFQQTPGGLKVRLGSIVDVLADRYDAGQLERVRNSAAGNQYLSLAELQAQGVPISYDPVYDEFNIGLTDTRPKAARKVHMDQISTPERGLAATGMAQVPRPR